MPRLAMMGVLCVMSLCGCATEPLDGPVHQEKLYRTGSNIPKREGNLPDGVETAAPSTADTRLGVPGMPAPMPGGR